MPTGYRWPTVSVTETFDREEDAEAAESDALTAAHAAGTVFTEED